MPATQPPLPAAVLPRPKLRRIGRPRAYLTLAALVFASAASLTMMAARGFYVGDFLSEYRFLPWNLLLAGSPMAFAFVT